MTVYDRWYRTERTADGGTRRVRLADYGCAKRWQWRWRDESGAQRKQSFSRRADAEAFGARIQTQLADGSYVDPRGGRVTLRERGEEYRLALTVDAPTLELITTRLNRHVYPELGDLEMAALARRPSRFQQWIRGMEVGNGEQKPLAPGTIKGVVSLVSAVFAAALDDGIVSKNPLRARSVRTPKAVKKKVTPWTLAQVDAVAGALPDRLAAMVWLAVGCGHRQGEAFAVADIDVDFLGRSVAVVRQIRAVANRLVFAPPKGGKERSVPLPDTIGLRLAEHMRKYRPVSVTLPWRVPDGPPVTHRVLFATRSHGPLWSKSVNRSWRAAVAAAGLPVCRENGMHVARHIAASAWLAAGVDVRTVAQYLGHQDPAFTLRTYAHLMPDAADRARRAMDTFFTVPAVPSCALDVPGGGSR